MIVLQDDEVGLYKIKITFRYNQERCIREFSLQLVVW